ncbi:aldose 1-epimerase [Vibrio variabilis]|uniref:Aldose 1-epimerase n=1 Tax=Vibrio variabilis TaxID=990271 RepID=A0ABQ0JI75_9VIBR|nr:aldose 1-epimerase [Vibrio variabilis]
MGIEFSGIAKDGQAPKLVTLSNAAGMEITVMDIGAAWLSCKVPVDNSLREVLLGVSSIEDYERQKSTWARRLVDMLIVLLGGNFRSMEIATK